MLNATPASGITTSAGDVGAAAGLSRRAFLGRVTLATAGVVVADQLDMAQAIAGWTRRLFPGFGPGHAGMAFRTSRKLPAGVVYGGTSLDEMLRRIYEPVLDEMLRFESEYMAVFGDSIEPPSLGKTGLVSSRGRFGSVIIPTA